MDQNWSGAAPQNQSGGNGQMGPSMPPVPGAGMNAPMMGPQMAGPANIPANPLAPPMPDSSKKGSVIETIILVVVCLIAAGAIVAAVMFYMQYNELNVDFQIKVSDAREAAMKEQKDLDEKDYLERSRLTTKEFTGPDDYGSLSFYYPKDWNVYIASDGTKNSDFKAYFAPGGVNSLNDPDSRYSLRFFIQNQQSDQVMRVYNNKVTAGQMTSRIFSAQNDRISGVLYEGDIIQGMKGLVLVVKINDKTAILQADAETYREEFETLITTLRRNS